jgi:ABC-type multidrug transport system ATPase subunit
VPPIAPPVPPTAPFAPPPSYPPPQAPPPPAELPIATEEHPKGRGLIERMADATRKLRASRPAPHAEEPSTTHRLPLKSAARTVGVNAHRLALTADGHEVLTEVSFTARPGTLTAVAGPSAARNSALLGVLAGTRAPSAGLVTVDSHDVYAEPESMGTRIGVVPRDERIHRRLTVERALGYAAELRLPPDTPPEQRDRVVDQVLEELELTPDRTTRIGKLSPELRRCASVAIELITRPTLLVVDEPSAGLDAAQETHVMAVLRRQADLGCVVVVATTSLTHLNMCDQVLLLTPAGSMAFAGAPLQIESAMGTADWPAVLAQIRADPDGAYRAFSARQQAQDPPVPPEVSAPWPPQPALTRTRQAWLVARRQARLLVADPLYSLFLVALPFALAALTLLIPGDSGLDRPAATSRNLHEAVEILAALNIAAVILGSALAIRDLVGERRVFRREQAVGLSTSAYLAAKIVFFSVLAALLTAILFTIVVADKGRPAHGATLLQNATVELYVSVALTAIVSSIVGLALSTLGKSLREVLLLAVPVILASLLFSGGLITLVGTWGYDQISWFIPAQWGFAASASTVDIHRVDTQTADIEMWTHYAGWWMFDMIVLAIFGAAWAGFVRYRLRPPTREIRQRPLQQELPV